MIKLKKVLNTPIILKKLMAFQSTVSSGSVHNFNFDSEEDIVQNVLGKILLIGMNLSDSKNLLHETALKKLKDTIINFDKNENLSVAILHGCTGIFCTGTVPGKEAEILSLDLLKTLNELKKPIIGSLEGYTTNFGVFLAQMCDLRFMDSACLFGFNDVKDEFNCPSFVYKRLLWNIGLSRTLELLCVNKLQSANDLMGKMFSSKVVESGCALGKSLIVGQNLAFHRPLMKVIKYKTEIYSSVNEM